MYPVDNWTWGYSWHCAAYSPPGRPPVHPVKHFIRACCMWLGFWRGTTKVKSV